MMLMKSSLGLVIGLLLGAMLLAEHRAELPDTPVGKELAELLLLWESGQGAQEYVERRFSSRMLEAYSVGEHVDFFRQVSQVHGGFWLEAVDQKGDYELAFLGRSRKRTDTWRRMTLRLEDDPPHRVDSMTIEQAQPLRILDGGSP